MRKTVKILHTVASAGLIGGLMAYMVLLLQGTPETPARYAELRGSISDVSNYLLLPSLAIALISGLLSMVVHKPYMEKRWVWVKAALGILMFKGVLTIVSAKADYATSLATRLANGEDTAQALNAMLLNEWLTVIAILAISIANVVLGVWRPRLKKREQPASRGVLARPREGQPSAL